MKAILLVTLFVDQEMPVIVFWFIFQNMSSDDDDGCIYSMLVTSFIKQD